MTTLPARPTLAQLRVFLAVARAGAFSEAAAELGMSQSSLSEGVASLERALGKRVLTRSAGGVTLTPTGERVLEHAARAVQASDDLLHAVQDVASLQGILRLAAPRSVATHLLPAALAGFRQLHPGVQVQLIDAESEGRNGETLLLSGRVDVAIVHLPVQGPLLAWPFYRDDYVLAVRAAGASVAARGRASWADLSGQPLLLPPEGDSCNRLMRVYLGQHQPVLPMVLEVENDSVMLGMVAHGLGQAILPRLAALPLPPGVRLLGLPVPVERRLGLAVVPARSGLPVIAALTSSLLIRP